MIADPKDKSVFRLKFSLAITSLAMLVFVVMGFIAAATGQQKPLPLVGEHYQKWFANAFN